MVTTFNFTQCSCEKPGGICIFDIGYNIYTSRGALAGMRYPLIEHWGCLIIHTYIPTYIYIITFGGGARGTGPLGTFLVPSLDLPLDVHMSHQIILLLVLISVMGCFLSEM